MVSRTRVRVRVSVRVRARARAHASVRGTLAGMHARVSVTIISSSFSFFGFFFPFFFLFLFFFFLLSSANQSPFVDFIRYKGIWHIFFQLLDTLPVCQDFNRQVCNRPACKFIHLSDGELFARIGAKIAHARASV